MKTNIKFYISSTLFKLLKSKDIYNISISELSREANISRSTFYNNFSNIIEVVDYRLDLIINDILNLYIINKHRKRSINEFFIQFFKYIEKNKPIFLIIKDKIIKLFKEKLDNVFLENDNNFNDYIIKSGSIINIVYLFLENKIDKNTVLNLLNKI